MVSRKPRGPNSWKRTELIRAVKAAKDSGASVARVELERGKISLVLSTATDNASPVSTDDVEKWIRKHAD